MLLKHPWMIGLKCFLIEVAHQMVCVSIKTPANSVNELIFSQHFLVKMAMKPKKLVPNLDEPLPRERVREVFHVHQLLNISHHFYYFLDLFNFDDLHGDLYILWNLLDYSALDNLLIH